MGEFGFITFFFRFLYCKQQQIPFAWSDAKGILPCVELIDKSRFDEAYKLYKAKSMELEAAY